MKVGSKVRYIGGQKKYKNSMLYALIGRTGTIKQKSNEKDMDWHVVMDIGLVDLDAQEKALELIDENESDIKICEENQAIA